MATISGSTIINANKMAVLLWTLGNADTGVASDMFRWADRTVQVSGTFGGATIVIEGSNDKTTWFTLNDNAGLPLSFTAAGMKLMLENPIYVRPVSSGGTGTSVAISIAGAGGQ